MSADSSLDAWGEALVRHGGAKLAEAISATGLVIKRPGFGQTVRPAAGSVLASPAVAFEHGEPDYFFHWNRDSAVVMEAVRILASAEGRAGPWVRRFNEFVRFCLDLREMDGKRFLASSDFRTRTCPEFQQFLRSDEEIAAIEGERVPGEPRYNADGSLDYQRWNRPQDDGPALRALVAMRFEEEGLLEDGEPRKLAAELIEQDLRYTAENAARPCYGIWEEELGQHYYTTLVQLAALEKGAGRAEKGGAREVAEHMWSKAESLRGLLDRFWDSERGFYRSRLPGALGESSKALDFSVILGILHAGLDGGLHSISDERVQRTLAKLEALFAAEYAINRGAGPGIMFGRYKGDNYFSGGAYYFSTFGAAEFHYRLAQAVPANREAHIDKGDAILSRVRIFVPPSGDLSEQFDQSTGSQSSAKDLTWSYASFITAWHARQAALGQGE
jgi:glucoamylase